MSEDEKIRRKIPLIASHLLKIRNQIRAVDTELQFISDSVREVCRSRNVEKKMESYREAYIKTRKLLRDFCRVIDYQIYKSLMHLEDIAGRTLWTVELTETFTSTDNLIKRNRERF